MQRNETQGNPFEKKPFYNFTITNSTIIYEKGIREKL